MVVEIMVVGVMLDEVGLIEKFCLFDIYVWWDGVWVVDEKIVVDKVCEVVMNDFFVWLENVC